MSKTVIESVKHRHCANNNLLSKYRSALMGISIIMIYVFHFTEDCASKNYNYSGWIPFFKTYIGSSIVDAFLFLSGLGLFYSIKKNPDILEFYRRRVIKILNPYTVIALPSWIIFDIHINKLSMIQVLKDFSFYTFFNKGKTWYWYIGFMLFCYIIYPYLYQIVNNARNAIEGEMYMLVLCSSITLLALIFAIYKPHLFNYIRIALLRLPFFIFGCFYGRSSFENRNSYYKWLILLVISSIGLSLLPASSQIISRYIMGLFNISLCAVIAWCLSYIHSCKLVSCLNWIGIRSLELYLTQVTIRKFMKYYGYYTCQVKYELIMIILSVIAAICLHKILQLINKGLALLSQKTQC